MLAQKQQLLVRYYLWATDGPWRLPSRLHYDLMDRKVALPQYAGTKQKVLEVFARRIGVKRIPCKGRALSLCSTAHLALQKHLATLVLRPLVCLDCERDTAWISFVLRCLCVLWIAWASTV